MTNRPRRIRGRLLLIANLAVANATAALWLVTFLNPGLLGTAGGTTGDNGAPGGRGLYLPLDTGTAWLACFAAALLLVLNFAWLVRRREPEAPSSWILSRTGSGTVRVAREAIEAALRLAGEALPEVTRARVAVDNRNHKRILVTTLFSCAEGQKHLSASQRLQKALAARFDELVRLDDGQRVEFELEFQGFAGKLAKNAADVPPPEHEEDEAMPFTGPQYPIDDDDDDLGGPR